MRQPELGEDHFQTLGMAPSFDVSSQELSERHLSYSRRLHPDHAGDDPASRAKAVMLSAQVNEAYSVLKDPFQRAEYLLGLEGGPAASEDKRVPAGFLEEMLELRDDLEGHLASGKQERVTGFREFLEGRLGTLRDELRDLFAVEARNLPEIRQTLNVAAYFRGLLRDLRDGA